MKLIKMNYPMRCTCADKVIFVFLPLPIRWGEGRGEGAFIRISTVVYIFVLLSCTGLLSLTAAAQNYSLDWHKVAGGGATSTGGVYSVSGTIGQHDASLSLTGGSDSVTGGFWALYAVQTSGAPILFITRSGKNAVLYWSASATGYQLENKSDLGNPGAWTSVLPAPVLLSGFNYVTNPIVGGNNFYRLHHP